MEAPGNGGPPARADGVAADGPEAGACTICGRRGPQCCLGVEYGPGEDRIAEAARRELARDPIADRLIHGSDTFTCRIRARIHQDGRIEYAVGDCGFPGEAE